MGYDEEKEADMCTGEIQLSICVLPMEQAEKFPQGAGRDTPNDDPHCPKPEGRLELSINPFKMFMQMIGPAVRRKIYCMLLCVACAFLCTMMAPMIASNVITKVVVGR